MKSFFGAIGLCVAVHALPVAAAQEVHVHQPPAASKPAPQKTPVRPLAPGAKPAAAPCSPAYDSALAGYRRFDASEPLRDWRAVNDEVREAGGHVGILKAQRAEQPK